MSDERTVERPSAAPARSRRFEPPVTDTSQPFWDATRERRLVLQWCTACERAIWYPRDFCPSCSERSTLEWRSASGRGEVYAFTVETRPTMPQVFGDEPFVIALVDLDEGVRVLGNVVGVPPDEVTVGMRVEVTWEELSDGRHLPLFEPTPD
jgi:uncharacterized OB-fold protein